MPDFTTAEADVPKVLILHGVNYYNAGDHGIVLSMCRAIRGAIPGAQIVAASPFLANIRTDPEFVERTKEGFQDSYPKEILDLYQVPVGKKRKALVLFFAFKIMFYVITLTFLPYPLRKLLARTTEFGSAVLDANVVLSKGGGFLLDRGTTYTIPTHLATIWISVLLRKKTIIYAQSIGPFENSIGRLIAKFVLQRVTFVLARDEYSETYAKKVLGVRPDKVRLTADSAFELASALVDDAATARSGAGEVATRGRVCITLVSPRYSGLPGQAAEGNYCAVIANAAEYLAAMGYQVVFIPHLESGAHSDRILAHRIRDCCSPGAQARTEVLEPTNPINIINFMAQCDFGVCSRMHSMIFAIDANLPFVALSYLPKSASMLAEAELDDWKLSLRDLAQGNVAESSDAIIAKLDEMIAKLPENRPRARAAQLQFVGRAQINTEVLAEILCPPLVDAAPHPRNLPANS